MADNRPRPPATLEKAGRRVWREIIAEFDLDRRELLLLEQAARQADAVAALDEEIASSGIIGRGYNGQPRLAQTVVELRQARLALSKLLGELALPDTDYQTAASKRGRKAAEARWGKA